MEVFKYWLRNLLYYAKGGCSTLSLEGFQVHFFLLIKHNTILKNLMILELKSSLIAISLYLTFPFPGYLW